MEPRVYSTVHPSPDPSRLCFCFSPIHLSVPQTKTHEPSSYQSWGSEERTRSGPVLRRVVLPGEVSRTGEDTGAPSPTGRLEREASRRVRKGLEVGLRVEPPMQLIMSDFQNKPQPPGLPSLPQAPILLSLPLASTRPLLHPDFSHPLLSLSLPKKPAAGLGAAAAGGAAAG